MNKNTVLAFLLGGVIVGLVVVGFASRPQETLGGLTRSSIETTGNLHARGNVQASGTLVAYGATTLSGDVTLSDDVDITGAASSTRSGGNFIFNSTSTGIVIRATDGNCYLIGIGASSFTTSTASCN